MVGRAKYAVWPWAAPHSDHSHDPRSDADGSRSSAPPLLPSPSQKAPNLYQRPPPAPPQTSPRHASPKPNRPRSISSPLQRHRHQPPRLRQTPSPSSALVRAHLPLQVLISREIVPVRVQTLIALQAPGRHPPSAMPSNRSRTGPTSPSAKSSESRSTNSARQTCTVAS